MLNVIFSNVLDEVSLIEKRKTPDIFTLGGKFGKRTIE